MRHITFCFVIICVLNICASAQATEFTYQGSLNIGSPPAPTTGNYDFEFRLFAVDTGGSAIGTLQRLNVAVSNGVFSVKLDFGAQFPGATRYLEIGVRTAGGGSFQTLLPRNQISNTPYSVRSLNSASADTANQLGGITASGFIQNTTSQQPASNFNISGNGAIGGNLGVGTTAPATKLDVSGTGGVRARVNSDLNAGVGLTLNNQPGWSVATVTGGQFQIFNDMIGQNAVWIDPATNNVGIGSVSTTEKLSVAGTIQSTSGGFRFPDGSLQTSANPTYYTTFQSTTIDLHGWGAGEPDSTLLHLNLPNGTYLLTATVSVQNTANFIGQNNNRTFECRLTGDSGSGDAAYHYHSTIFGPSNITLSFHSVVVISSGNAEINCHAFYDFPTNVAAVYRRLTAVAVNAVIQ